MEETSPYGVKLVDKYTNNKTWLGRSDVEALIDSLQEWLDSTEEEE